MRYLLGLAHLRSDDLDAAVDDLLAATRARPDDLEMKAALEEALERLLAASAEERAAGEEALETLAGSPVGNGPVPGAGGEGKGAVAEAEMAALDELVRWLVNSCTTDDTRHPAAKA